MHFNQQTLKWRHWKGLCVHFPSYSGDNADKPFPYTHYVCMNEHASFSLKFKWNPPLKQNQKIAAQLAPFPIICSLNIWKDRLNSASLLLQSSSALCLCSMVSWITIIVYKTDIEKCFIHLYCRYHGGLLVLPPLKSCRPHQPLTIQYTITFDVMCWTGISSDFIPQECTFAFLFSDFLFFLKDLVKI